MKNNYNIKQLVTTCSCKSGPRRRPAFAPLSFAEQKPRFYSPSGPGVLARSASKGSCSASLNKNVRALAKADRAGGRLLHLRYSALLLSEAEHEQEQGQALLVRRTSAPPAEHDPGKRLNSRWGKPRLLIFFCCSHLPYFTTKSVEV